MCTAFPLFQTLTAHAFGCTLRFSVISLTSSLLHKVETNTHTHTQLDARESTIKKTTAALFTGTKIMMLKTAPSVSVSKTVGYADLLETSRGLTCVLEVSAIAPVFETRTSAGVVTCELRLTNNWVAHGMGHAPPTFTKNSDGVVTLSGMVKDGAWGDVACLPADYRPSMRLIFNLSNHDGSCRVDVLADGRVVWVAGSNAHAFLSLDGISFSTKAAKQPLPLTNGWVAYGGYHAPPTYTKNSDGVVTLSGMAKGGGTRGDFACLPTNYRPNGRLVFNVSNHTTSCRIDVFPDGRVTWVSGGKSQNWIPLNVSFSTKITQQQLPLANGWVAYGGDYAPPTYTKSSLGMVTLSGLIKDGTWGDVGCLPNHCRPSTRLVST